MEDLIRKIEAITNVNEEIISRLRMQRKFVYFAYNLNNEIKSLGYEEYVDGCRKIEAACMNHSFSNSIHLIFARHQHFWKLQFK
jgi:hypothetical protein